MGLGRVGWCGWPSFDPGFRLLEFRPFPAPVIAGAKTDHSVAAHLMRAFMTGVNRSRVPLIEMLST